MSHGDWWSDRESKDPRCTHPVPYSPGGICFERYADFPDWHLDYWHPLEKARYPYYFARREAAKQELLQLYEKMYGTNPEVAIGTTVYQEYTEEPATDEEKMYGPFLRPSRGATASGRIPVEVGAKGKTEVHDATKAH